MTDVTTPFGLAAPPAKDEILALLDAVRGDAERDEVLAIVIIPISTDKRWATMSAGDISMLELGGLLGRAWLSAMEAVES